MKYIAFDKTLCNVKFLLNIIDLQSECAMEMTSETQTAGFFQVYFIQNAKGYLRLNDEVIELQPNTLLFISQNQNYSWHIEPSSFSGRLLVFQEDFLNDFFSDQHFIYRLLYFYQTAHPLHYVVSEPEFNDLLSRLQEIRNEIINTKSDSAHLIRSILYYILISLNRTYAEKNQLTTAIANDNTAYQFRKLVEKNITTLHKVEDYSDLMKLSRISVNKAVKAQFNVTATEFIKSRLLFEIKMKLIHTSLSVSEIAYAYAFSEIQHLHRFFKQRTGKSPMEYRQHYQNE